MAKISIQRQKTFIGAAQAFQVYVDDNKIGKLWSGKTKSFDILPGEHTLQIRSDLKGQSRSPKINFMIQSGEEIRYITKYTRFAYFFLIFLMIWVIFLISAIGNFTFLSDLPILLRLLLYILPVAIFYFSITHFWKEKFKIIEEVERISEKN